MGESDDGGFREVEVVDPKHLPIDNGFSSTVSKVADGLTIRIPKPECPLYRQGDAVFVTTSRKWAKILKDVEKARVLEAHIKAAQERANKPEKKDVKR
jgi:hypothetical protein